MWVVHPRSVSINQGKQLDLVQYKMQFCSGMSLIHNHFTYGIKHYVNCGAIFSTSY